MGVIAKITDEDFGEKSQENLDPRVRIASRGIVINAEGKIAIFNKENMNEFKLPGGGKEGHESEEATFIREVFEETGCKVEVVKELGTVEEYRTKANFKQISTVFVGKVIEDTNNPSMTDREVVEGGKVIWRTPEEGLKLISDCYENVIPSPYENEYASKYVVYRDKKIMEYYLNNQ